MKRNEVGLGAILTYRLILVKRNGVGLGAILTYSSRGVIKYMAPKVCKVTSDFPDALEPFIWRKKGDYH